MSAPVRVQLSRRKGWRMPPNTVSVARPTKWGNPFRIGMTLVDVDARRLNTAEAVVSAFREMLSIEGRNYSTNDEIESELRGKNLACWCQLDQSCHADVLLELANSDSKVGAA